MPPPVAHSGGCGDERACRTAPAYAGSRVRCPVRVVLRRSRFRRSEKHPRALLQVFGTFRPAWLGSSWGEEATNIRAASWIADQVSDDRLIYRSSSLVNQLVATRAGLGAALMPCYLGDPEPELRRIGQPIKAVEGELWIVTHADLRMTARVRAFLDVVGDGLASRRWAIEGVARNG